LTGAHGRRYRRLVTWIEPSKGRLSALVAMLALAELGCSDPPPPAYDTNAGDESGTETGECTLGSENCECAGSLCLGELVCVEGMCVAEVCTPGAVGCECVEGECLGGNACVDDVCMDPAGDGDGDGDGD